MPDELISLRGILQIDLLRGQIKAPLAYFEGTFNYYLWALPQAALKLSSNTGLASTASALPSIGFDLAYVKAMKQKDARSMLRKDLRQLVSNRIATIGIARPGNYFYTVMPAVDRLKSETIKVQVQDSDQKADFFLVGFEMPIDSRVVDAVVKRIEAQGNFRYEKTYSVRPKIFGRELRLARFPQDMTYPFPTILLFRAKVET